MPSSTPSRRFGTALAAVAVAFAGFGQVVAAQDEAEPSPGIYQRVVAADAATDELQAGTYTLTLQGGKGSLLSEYNGFPGTTCPFTSSVVDGNLVLDFGHVEFSPCSRTTTLLWRTVDGNLQFLHKGTDPKDKKEHDRAVFEGAFFVPIGSAPTPAPTIAASTRIPDGTWEVALTADDFAPYFPPSADMTGSAATYVLSFLAGTGSFTAEVGGAVIGTCPIDIQTPGAAGTMVLTLGGQCGDRETSVVWVTDGDQLTFSNISTIPTDNAAFDRALFGVKPWTLRDATAAPMPSAVAGALQPMDGTYTVRLKKTDMQPYLDSSAADAWRPTTFTLVLAGTKGSIHDNAKRNEDFDADFDVSASDSDYRIIVVSRHTDIHTGWTQAADGTLTFSNLTVSSAADADAWKGVLGAKPWTMTKP